MKEEPRCSFCKKDQEAVNKLISNPDEDKVRVYICDRCVDTCKDILLKLLGTKSSLLFGMEVARLQRMEQIGLIKIFDIRKVVEVDGCTLVIFLEQLKHLLDIANTNFYRVEMMEISEAIERLEREVITERKSLEAKTAELKALKEKLSNL